MGHDGVDQHDNMDEMLLELGAAQPPVHDEEPTPSASAFYRMVDSANESVHENTMHSKLSAIARLLALKSEYNMSIAHYDDTLQLIHELLPPESNLARDFYHSKKLLQGLGMTYIKIDVCYNNCMLYYKENEHKDKCDFCNTPRFEDGQNKVPRKVLRYLPIADRLQRLYAHEDTAKAMQSHKKSTTSKLVHPCDGEAWQQFDIDFPDFGRDPRNVRLVISTDGFTPFNIIVASYSCWPVFISPLNLPRGILLRAEYIFLALVISGPEHPGKKLSILMQPLVDDLLKLWEGVETWDATRKERFNMRVAFLWSVHDCPAYGNFAAWSTHGVFFPRDHEFRFQSNAFRKNTIVLDEAPRILTGEELPYFHKLLLPHNIDVMHNEKNVAEAIWNTCFNIPNNSKDNVKARQDILDICNRPSLHLELKGNGKWHKPRATFCIDRNDKKIILKWFQDLKFPNGYAANIRRGVNLLRRRVFGLKSHDYHIFIERLLPVAFRGFLPENIWVCLAELSFFYRQLCAKELSKDVVQSLEQNIAVLLCKLENIFPPGFFNLMQHLIVHLPREARLGGPVLARWMYPYERQFDKEQWKSRIAPTDKQHRDLRLNGWKYYRGTRHGPNFFDWFKKQCMIKSSIDSTLWHISYGFSKRVTSYGCYDVNGCRFRSEKYESAKPGLSTINTGVCMSCVDDDDNVIDYFGVIEDIIKITWEGSMNLELVLFDCRWFDPTPEGVRRTENLGLVEVKHTSRLSNFESFVLASQIMNNLRHRALASKKRPDSHSSSTSNTNGASSQRSVPSTNGTQVNPANSTAEGQNHESHRVTGTQDRQPPAQRGRKERSGTNLAVPRRGRKVGLIPRGEMQFKYVNYQAAEYKYTTQLGVILKREYPGTVEDLDNDGRIIRSRPALHWADYYLKRREGDGETCADRVINEFWRLFTRREELKDAADRVLENYAYKRVNDMMYQHE
ncbi:uncharacterized protein LOC107304359 [Oryza brachyantha]|uniref:uncharacterized protein LOC107304359 n=1 Tax=Oryza brachyantha TaxID=4533 RepID=UPI001ADD4B03|nr:uncharacterized protein LOC107304359 [Oryza brachyantha]